MRSGIQVSKEVNCPFYIHEEAHRLVCEGIEPGTTISITRTDGKGFDSYKKRYCDRVWQNCRIAKMLLQKYEKELESN